MTDLTTALLSGASAVITTNAGGPVTLDLTPTTATPSATLTALQPQVEVWRDGERIAVWAPYGTPKPFDWTWVWVGAFVSLALLLWARVRRG